MDMGSRAMKSGRLKRRTFSSRKVRSFERLFLSIRAGNILRLTVWFLGNPRIPREAQSSQIFRLDKSMHKLL
jgi:hypothetical protein